jgi:hypothetical protein
LIDYNIIQNLISCSRRYKEQVFLYLLNSYGAVSVHITTFFFGN